MRFRIDSRFRTCSRPFVFLIFAQFRQKLAHRLFRIFCAVINLNISFLFKTAAGFITRVIAGFAVRFASVLIIRNSIRYIVRKSLCIPFCQLIDKAGRITRIRNKQIFLCASNCNICQTPLIRKQAPAVFVALRKTMPHFSASLTVNIPRQFARQFHHAERFIFKIDYIFKRL